MPRQYYIDWLRIGAFVLLVLYHVGMVYVPWSYHFKHQTTYAALEPWMRMSNPWRMSLLFAVSGVATGLMSGRAGLTRARSRRLLLPLLLGVVLVVPPQAYFEAVQKYGYNGTYPDFLGLYFTAYGGFCKGNTCLILPTWNHLWFLPYLWLYTMVLLGWQHFAKPNWSGRSAVALTKLSAFALLVLPAVWFALLRTTLMPWFGETHALVDDPWSHLSYGSMFAFGVAASRQPALLDRLQVLRWPALGLAVAAWVLFTTLTKVQNTFQPMLLNSAVGVQQWCGVVAAFGFARVHLNRDHPWRAPLTQAVFPLYLWHQTLIIVGAALFAPLAWPARAEAALLVAFTFGGCLMFWRISRYAGPLKEWLGLGPDRG